MTVSASTDFPWLTERTGYEPTSGARGIMASLADGTPAGIVVFDGWTPGACWMHVALAHPAACRGLLYAAFAYVFQECDRALALGAVRASNKRSLALASHLGFEVLARVPGGWAEGEDVVLMAMTRNECRWIQKKRRAA